MKCRTCEKKAHPAFGDQCEDCWASHQRPSSGPINQSNGLRLMVSEDSVTMSDSEHQNWLEPHLEPRIPE